MKNKTMRVDYHSDPNMPENVNHIGSKCKLTGQSFKEFDNECEAIKYWGECSWPITKLQEIYSHELAAYINEICKEELDALPNEIEEYIHSQKEMYELVEDVNFEDSY